MSSKVTCSQRSTPSINPQSTFNWLLNWQLMDILVQIQLTLDRHVDQHLIDSQLIVGWVLTNRTLMHRITLNGVSVKIRWLLTECCPTCSLSADRVSMEVLIEWQLSVNWIWIKHQSWVSIECVKRLVTGEAFSTKGPSFVYGSRKYPYLPKKVTEFELAAEVGGTWGV